MLPIQCPNVQKKKKKHAVFVCLFVCFFFAFRGFSGTCILRSEAPLYSKLGCMKLQSFGSGNSDLCEVVEFLFFVFVLFCCFAVCFCFCFNIFIFLFKKQYINLMNKHSTGNFTLLEVKRQHSTSILISFFTYQKSLGVPSSMKGIIIAAIIGGTEQKVVSKFGNSCSTTVTNKSERTKITAAILVKVNMMIITMYVHLKQQKQKHTRIRLYHFISVL